MSKTISTSVTAPVVLNPATDNPLTITSAGTVTATGTIASIYGIGTNWTVSNSGSVSAATADGFKLSGGATLTNETGGVITSSGTHGGGLSVGAGIYIQNGSGHVTNNGAISGGGYGVALGSGGLVTNTSSITGGEDSVIIQGGAGTIMNSGTLIATVDDGIGLFSGGSVTNTSGASISGHGGAGIYITGALGTVTNAGAISGYQGLFITNGGSISNATSGSISGTHNGIVFKNQAGTITNSGKVSGTGSGGTGLYLQTNSTVTNTSTGSISGGSFGIFATAGGTVTNAGTISGATYAVDFTGSGTNRLIVDPGAMFIGNVAANSTAANTLELASGTGSIGSVGTAFSNFQTLAVDAGGNWTLTDANTTTSVLDAGSLDIAGTLSATSIAFQGSGSALLIDNAATFGSNVGTPSYTGPQLQDFVSGDKVDLKNISSAGATFSYDASTGLLQVANSFNQMATLDFQNSSLGSGSFELSSDGASGTLITTDGLPEPPVLMIADPSLPVTAGGSVALGIAVTPVDSDDTTFVTISGVPQGFENIIANNGGQPVSHHGSNYTFTEAEVNSGLTLVSSYKGHGQPVNTLTVTASNTTAGETGTSAAQTITVTDPPATLASHRVSFNTVYSQRADRAPRGIVRSIRLARFPRQWNRWTNRIASRSAQRTAGLGIVHRSRSPWMNGREAGQIGLDHLRHTGKLRKGRIGRSRVTADRFKSLAGVQIRLIVLVRLFQRVGLFKKRERRSTLVGARTERRPQLPKADIHESLRICKGDEGGAGARTTAPPLGRRPRRGDKRSAVPLPQPFWRSDTTDLDGQSSGYIPRPCLGNIDYASASGALPVLGAA